MPQDTEPQTHQRRDDQARAGAEAAAAAARRDDSYGRPFASLVKQPAQAVSALGSDTFVGAAGSSLAAHPSTFGANTWTEDAGVWQLTGSGKVSPTTLAGTLRAILAVPPGVTRKGYSASVDMLIDRSASSGVQSSLLFRYLDANNYWYVQSPPPGINDWRVIRRVNGTDKVRMQFSSVKANGATVNIRVELWGRDITLFIDNVEMYTVSDPALQANTNIGLRQNIAGSWTNPAQFSNVQVKTYSRPKLNVPRFVNTASTQVLPHGGPGTWEQSDANNPNVTWDPANKRWVLYYSGYSSASGTPTRQGLGLAYADSLAGPWAKDPRNPIVPANASGTGIQIENGGLIWVAGRWLRVQDQAGMFTSPDLLTWTMFTPTGLRTPNFGDPFLRITDSGLLEMWYGLGVPATAICRAVSADGGLTWDDPATPFLSIPSYVTTRGHGEPSVFVPQGKEGMEYVIFFDSMVTPDGEGTISCAITVDGGATWRFQVLVGGSGSGFDAFQKFDSFPVLEGGLLHLFHCASPIVGGEVNLDASIGHMTLQWTPEPIKTGPDPIPYQ